MPHRSTVPRLFAASLILAALGLFAEPALAAEKPRPPEPTLGIPRFPPPEDKPEGLKSCNVMYSECKVKGRMKTICPTTESHLCDEQPEPKTDRR